MPNRNRKQLTLAAAGVAGVAAVALVVVWLVDYAQHQRWLLEDANTLQPYQHVLLENGQLTALGMNGGTGGDGGSESEPGRLGPMAETVMAHNQALNLLLEHLSMSDPRRNIWRTRSYVKVFIVTQVAGLPPGESRTRKVKAVYTLAASEAGWRLVNTSDRTIE